MKIKSGFIQKIPCVSKYIKNEHRGMRKQVGSRPACTYAKLFKVGKRHRPPDLARLFLLFSVAIKNFYLTFRRYLLYTAKSSS